MMLHNLTVLVDAAIPDWMREATVVVLAALVAIAVALVVHRMIFRVMRRVARASGNTTDDMVLERLARPTRYALAAIAIVVAAREIPALSNVWQKVAGMVMPALLGWIALALLHALANAMMIRADISVADNHDARRKRTRLTIFSRIATALVIFITVGLMLLSIPGVRDIGVTLMASAGLAGLAVGAAAQPALKSLIAGLQMALTEPISIDDVVIIDGEWGWIEDIKTTYVVVKIWDQRRLVVPTTRFLEETFENWTRSGAAILGSVMLHLDPLTTVQPIRAEFERQVAANPRWDKRVAVVHVVEMDTHAMQLRLLMSAADSPTAFELRCEIREGMLAWLREHMPEAVVRHRLVQVDGAGQPVLAG